MKVVRLLVYEGSQESIEKHFQQTFVSDDGKSYGSPHNVVIKELFRGEQKEAEVVHFDEDDFTSDIPF